MPRKISIIFLIFFFCNVNPLRLYGALKPLKFTESNHTGGKISVGSLKIKGAVVGNQNSKVSTDRLYVYMPKIDSGSLETRITSFDGVYDANIIYELPSEYPEIVELEFPTKEHKLLKNYKQKHLTIKTEFTKKQTSIPIIIVSSWDKLESLSNLNLFVYFNSSKGEEISIEVPRRNGKVPYYGNLEKFETDENSVAYNSFITLTLSDMFLTNKAMIIREIDWDTLEPKPLRIQLPNN